MFSMKLLLNPQSGYIKIGAYTLILCHVVSDVKLSRYFLLSKVKNVFLKLNNIKTSNRSILIESCSMLECRKTSTVKCTSLHLCILKFQL